MGIRISENPFGRLIEAELRSAYDPELVMASAMVKLGAVMRAGNGSILTASK
jgi:hypothetical protein